MRDFQGRRVVVMGLGRHGGGLGVTRYLAAQGADLLVTDTADAGALAESVAALQPMIDSGAVELRLGEHNVSDFTTADLVIANPAVPKPWDNRFLRAASAAGIEVSTELRLLVEALPNRSRTIGITGTNGKSTTAAMTHHALASAGVHAVLGGNIGGSLLPELDSITPETVVVLELSSAQLHWLKVTEAGWSPGVAVVTNVSPNHLDWHGTEDAYYASKAVLLEHQLGDDAAILGHSVSKWRTRPNVHRIIVEDEDALPGLVLPGAHNGINGAMAMLAASIAANTSAPSAAEAVMGFTGLPHRLQLVAELGGVRCFDDSKATTPASTLTAVRAFDDASHVHLIAGGYDKQIDLSAIASLAPDLAGFYTIGATGPMLDSAAGEHATPCGTLDVAVERALDRAVPGDVLLLSPGCASWDQFASFEERGRRFAELVAARGVSA